MHSPSVQAVTLKSTWKELFGVSDDRERRGRWERWKEIALMRAECRSLVEYWTETSECDGCLYQRGDWCALAQLPCTFNPVLSPRGGMLGMACCGMGYTPADGQLSLGLEWMT